MKTYVIAISFLVVGCGAAKNENRADQQQSQLASTTESTVEDAAMASIEGFDAAADSESDAQALSLSLARELGDKIDASRVCTEGESGDVSVVAHYARERAREVSRPRLSLSMSGSIVADATNHWSKEGADLNCDASKQHLAMEWTPDFLNGLRLERSFKRVAQMNLSVDPSAEGAESKARSRSWTAEGNRDASLASEKLEDGMILLTKTLNSSQVTRSLEIVRNGETKSHSRVNTVEIPLVIAKKYDPAQAEFVSREILSGKIKSVGSGGRSLEISFENVKHEKDSGCLPVSGKISGTKVVGEESHTFELVFDKSAEQPVTITIDGAAPEAAPEFAEKILGCELED